ncbi:MAG: hypothetical protein KC620_06545, partial [Myxococcales bacterium]|nr:hypothetical protein [Myxococcales bacterium]
AYEATLRWMERNLASSGARVRFETVIDLPEVIAAHVEAPNRKTRWTGINVSQYGGAVWIFVIARSGSE